MKNENSRYGKDGLASGRKARFIALVDALPLSQGGLSKWFNLENTKQGRESVSRKYRGSVAATPKDLALLNLLVILERDGYDLDSVSFADDGELLSLCKLGKDSAKPA